MQNFVQVRRGFYYCKSHQGKLSTLTSCGTTGTEIIKFWDYQLPSNAWYVDCPGSSPVAHQVAISLAFSIRF